MSDEEEEDDNEDDDGEDQDQIQRYADLAIPAYPYPPAEECEARGDFPANILQRGILDALEGRHVFRRGQAFGQGAQGVHGGNHEWPRAGRIWSSASGRQ